MGCKMKLSYQDIYNKCKDIKINPNSKIFAVPKGGLIPASIIASMNNSILIDSPDQADYIIDDLIDSGSTKKKYDIFNKPFIALYNKPTEWIEFPWEINELPAEDAVVRILQSIGEDVKREGLLDTPKRHIKYLKELQEKHNKIKLILSNENLGVCGGRTVLFEEALGDIIISLDSDAYLINNSFFDKIIDLL